jgi:hypothetical protein
VGGREGPAEAEGGAAQFTKDYLTNEIAVAAIDQTRTVVYYNRLHRKASGFAQAALMLMEDRDTIDMYEVAPHRVAKFKRAVPKAQSIDAVAYRFLDRVKIAADRADVRGMRMSDNDRQIVTVLNGERTLDPRVTEIQEAAKLGQHSQEVGHYHNARRLFRDILVTDQNAPTQAYYTKYPAIEVTEQDSGLQGIYPLVPSQNMVHWTGLRNNPGKLAQHAVMYVNAVYTANNTEVGNV